MESFIEKVAAELWEENRKDYSQTCIVFPTKRACAAFRAYFSKNLNNPVWGPEVVAINDLIEDWEEVVIADDLDLLFELFNCMRKYDADLTFEQFYNRGKILLSDFEEVDKNLVDAHALFKNLYDLKEIDDFFYEDDEHSQAIRNFWLSFTANSPSELQRRFLEFWKIIPKLYDDFNRQLIKKGITTSAKCYRNIAEQAKNKTLKTKYDKYVFAGFYAFLDTEIIITDYLLALGKAEILWDTDSYYVDDEYQEAGIKIRKNKTADYKWKSDYFKNTNKDIIITAVAHARAQASYVGNLLNKYHSDKNININKTAVVLCDENSLSPLLYSLPANSNNANITMGYPFGKSLAYDLIYLLYKLFYDYNKNESKSFYYKNIIPLLRLPLVNLFKENEINQVIKSLERNNVTHLSLKSISENKSLGNIAFLFQLPNNLNEWWEYLEKVLQHCIAFHSDLSAINSQELSLLKSSSYLLNQFKDSISKQNLEALTTENIWKLFVQQIKGTKIPFDRGTSDTLQIMGFLETRVLDFDHLIIMSANEGSLPAPSKSQSFIPFSLRKGYNLPTFEDHDAIYAYHFYRLLQRAKTIEIIYNATLDEMGQGEPSRYVLQLEYEMKRAFKDNINITHQLINSDLHSPLPRKIEIKKTDEIIQKLFNKYQSSNEKQKGISATGFEKYLSCSLRYYFNYVLNIQEPEEISEDLDASAFGTVFHDSIQALYEGSNFTETELEIQLKRAESEVDKQIEKTIHLSGNKLQGKNILLREVIINLIKKVIQNDINDLPIKLHSTEKKYFKSVELNSGKTILLEGTIDRIDEKNGFTRIIDYKTGKADLLGEKKEVVELFENADLKASLQLYYYATLLGEEIIQPKTQLGVYKLKEVTKGVQVLKRKNLTEDLAQYKLLLNEKLNELFDSSIPFSQTVEIKRCVYCPYKTICGR